MLVSNNSNNNSKYLVNQIEPYCYTMCNQSKKEYQTVIGKDIQ